MKRAKVRKNILTDEKKWYIMVTVIITVIILGDALLPSFEPSTVACNI